MSLDADALIIGAGPAGTAAAILLVRAGWRVILVEQHAYPRRKVCGECVAAGNFALLDELGVGPAFQRAAGPELRRIGWMGAAAIVTGTMPACDGPYAYGRALGRDRLDALLLERAHSLGVVVMQPARVRHVAGELGGFECIVESRDGHRCIRIPVVVDAHGSWERGPACSRLDPHGAHAAHRDSDLFAFKANFRHANLAAGFLPVLALPGGYGGMVVEQGGSTTLACCIRRNTLAACRRRLPQSSAGLAVEAYLRSTCSGVRAALAGAERCGAWLSVGPLRPGIRIDADTAAFRVGNAAGESHALIGEGISMALQSSALLAGVLTRHPAAAIRGDRGIELHRRYAAAWRRAFAGRLRLSAVYAHIAMRPAVAEPARALLGRWPAMLSIAARLAGKAASAAPPLTNPEIA